MYEYTPPLSSSETQSDDVGYEVRRESVEEAEHEKGFHEIGLAEPLTPITSRVERPTLTRTTTAMSTMSLDPTYEVSFDEHDKDDPRDWPKWYKTWIIFSCALSTTTVYVERQNIVVFATTNISKSVLYSSAYTSAIPGMMRDLNVSNEYVVLLGLTTYLLGLAVGSVICAPLSEMFGRRPIYLASLALYTLLVIPCALADRIGTILGVRFVAALIGVSTIANAPGSINDIVTEEYRALAFSIWSIGPMNGPVIGPLVGGFVFQYLGWRWVYWLTLILSGASLLCLFTIKETYEPAILRARAKKMRKETGNPKWWTRYDEKEDLIPLLATSLWRPFHMTFTEPILWFWDGYVSIVYGILCRKRDYLDADWLHKIANIEADLSFVAYPIVFGELRGWSSSMVGLSFLGIGLGNLITIACEPLIRRMINSHRPDPGTGKPPPEAMVSVICIAAVLIPAGELIFAFTCQHIFWLVPILAGIPFGAGNGAVFIYGSNYVVGSYGIYAASALAGNTFLRSVFGGCLPLAGKAMYSSLGPRWSGFMLGMLELVCLPIPFIFYKYGHLIRSKSRLISEMQRDKQKSEARMRRAQEKLEKLRRSACD